jgi:intein/homing endonuclease
MAEGSMIQMADGSLKPIEFVKIGDRIANPHHPGEKALTVMDTAKGTESVPMVRIQDRAGRSLLLTEMHPMPTVNRGMVQAKRLKVGDQVFTHSGISQLVNVKREAFNGKVYNLKVGSDSELQELREDETVVYANGFLVGDGRLQDKYTVREMTASAQGDVLKQLPKSWHKDYLNSKRR